MQQTHLNSFEILNTTDLEVEYDLFRISGVDRSVEGYDKSTNALVKKVGSNIRNIVVPIEVDNINYLAIPTSAENPEAKHIVGVHIFHLQKVAGPRMLRFNSIEPDNAFLAQEFLRGAIRRSLMRNRRDLWGDGSRSYFTKVPFFSNSVLQIYGGFSFDVIVTAEKQFAITINVSSRYVSPNTIKEFLQNGTALGLSPRKPLHCLYEMSQDWFSIEVTGILNLTVAEQHFQIDGEDRTVYDHTLRNAKPDVLQYYKSKLLPSDPVITFRYPNKRSQMILHAASSLARPKYNTEHEYVKQIHRKSILAPDRRISLASSYLRKYFTEITIGTKKIVLSTEPFRIPTRLFRVPDLLVGDDYVVHVKNGTSQGIRLEDLGRERLGSFLRHGVLDKSSPFRQTYFLVPDTMLDRKGILDDFQNRIIELIKQVSNRALPVRVIPYQTKNTLTLREQFKSIQACIAGIGTQAGCLIILLPKNGRPGLHNSLKKEYYKNYWMQCAKEDRLLSFFEQKADHNGNTLFQVISRTEKKYGSYIRNFVLGLLQVHRRWISCLKSPLHHDMHLGVDVLNDFWGFTFVYEGGRHCYFVPQQRPTSQLDYKEKIPKGKMFEIVYENLKSHIVELKLRPKSLLVHRDGRCFDSEVQALEKAIRLLVSEGILPEGFVFGIVEVHKSSGTRLRIIQQKDASSQFENPIVGSYYCFGSSLNEAAVATTGYPFSKSGNNPYGFDGTASPLMLRLAYGKLELEKVAEDVFRLSCLAWSAPDKASRLHLPIKLGDDFLEPMASKVEEDEAEEEAEKQMADWADNQRRIP